MFVNNVFNKTEKFPSLRTVKLIEIEPIEQTIAEVILKELKSVKESILQETSDVNDIKWAVRSSGVCEDSDEISAAGQNSTFLGITTDEELLKAIAACWASLFTFQSVQYRRWIKFNFFVLIRN